MSTVLLLYGKPILSRVAFKRSIPILTATSRLARQPLSSSLLLLSAFGVSKSLTAKLSLGFYCAFGLTAASAYWHKSMAAVDDAINRADELYKENKYQEVYDHLSNYKDSESVEILWRFARAAVDVGKLSNDKEFRKKQIYEAAEVMERAMKLDPSNAYVHKWFAFCIKYTGEYEGTKKQIQNSYKIKEHLERASELNPKDPTTQYALGSWAFTFADMSWMTRKMAAAIFDTPPTATYEDALKYFEKAEEMDPNFFSMNLLMIGKAYSALGKKDKAIEYLKRARDYSPKVSADDDEALKEATQLLSKLGVKN